MEGTFSETTNEAAPMTSEGHKTAHTEGKVARNIEHHTSKVPSDWFLWFAFGSMAASLTLRLTGKKMAANFIGEWVPTVLIMGVYNKMVKLFGHDRYSRAQVY